MTVLSLGGKGSDGDRTFEIGATISSSWVLQTPKWNNNYSNGAVITTAKRRHRLLPSVGLPAAAEAEMPPINGEKAG